MMRKKRTLWAVAGVITAAAVFAGGMASAHAQGSTVTYQCPVGSPCMTWRDTSTSGVQQDIELFDHAGNPIFWCNSAGGCWVGNDRLGVTGSSVFNEAAYLSTSNGTNGELVIDGVALNAKDIIFLTCMNKGGTLASCKNGG